MLKNVDVKQEACHQWRCQSFTLKEVPVPSQGTFFSGDSYVRDSRGS